MSSRKAQREAARERRLAEERARAEGARRQRRLRMLAGAGLAAVAVVAAAIAISAGNGGNGLQKGKAATATIAQVDALLGGIPQSGTRLGSPKAPVTLTYYGDLECPICRDFTLSSFPTLVANDVKQGRVQVVYRSLETATADPATFLRQQVAAYAAGQQQRFWHYTDLFYNQQGTEGTSYANDAYLNGLAKETSGLSYPAWLSARNNSALAAQVQSEVEAARSQGLSGTPTLIFQGPRGKAEPSQAVPTYSQLEQAVKQVA